LERKLGQYILKLQARTFWIYGDAEMKKYAMPVVMLAVFETVAVILWLTKGNLFYLFNFSYIGISVSLGVFLFIKKYKHARRIVQLLVGLYMLVYLGLICNENMQIEGFWYYLFTGVFEAATIHYAVAKIFGPLIFGRGWCGYACWTAMVLDFLPYKVPMQPRKRIGWIRYVAFVLSFAFVAALFLSNVGNIEKIMFWAFIVGNALYYAVGIILAFAFRDNRAFCKYVCPITVFMKPMSYFSLLRIKCDKSKCVSCGKCKKVCPMDVDMTDNSRKRKNGTDCIFCFECVKACNKKAL
jgi:polyferredoxin